MIRALRRKGLSYRAISDLCGCSHGSVHAEVVAMKKEDAEKKRLADLELAKAAEQESQAQNLGIKDPEPIQTETSSASSAFTYYDTVD